MACPYRAYMIGEIQGWRSWCENIKILADRTQNSGCNKDSIDLGLYIGFNVCVTWPVLLHANCIIGAILCVASFSVYEYRYRDRKTKRELASMQLSEIIGRCDNVIGLIDKYFETGEDDLETEAMISGVYSANRKFIRFSDYGYLIDMF
jgi:hypothetical protein